MLTYRHLSRMFTQRITQTFKFRFISASNKCSTAKSVINFCNKVYKHSGVSNCWGVANYAEVLDTLSSLDCKLDSMDSYGISTTSFHGL